MKKFIVFLMVMSLISCGNQVEQKKIQEENYGFQVIVIDSCEYLIKTEEYKHGSKWGTKAGYFAHKGNCKFCEERRQKQEKTVMKLWQE